MTGRALGVAVRIMSNDSFFGGIVIRPNRIIVLTTGVRRLLRLRLLWLRRWLWRRVDEERLDGSWNIFILETEAVRIGVLQFGIGECILNICDKLLISSD
jgi:hypothetical protein